VFGKLFPDRAPDAGLANPAVFNGAVIAKTRARIKRRLDQADYLTDRYGGRLSRQHVSSVRTPDTVNNVSLSKLLEKLFQELERDSFPLRDRRKRYRRAIRMLSDIEHRPH